MRARVHAGQGYVVETTAWEKRLHNVIAQANLTLEPELGARLEIVRTAPWGAREGSGGLRALLEELRKSDSGEGVDLVIGLTGSLPSLVFSFHELGVADMFGKYVVLRATNDAVEYEALQKALDELDQAERSRVYRARIAHKATCVLLHELGHALGAPHSRDPHDLMAPAYDTAMSGFAPETRNVLRAALTQPAEPAQTDPVAARAKALAAALSSSAPEHWVPAERDRTLARLESLAANERALTPSAPNAPSARSAPDAPTALRPADQGLYHQVVAARDAGNFSQALELGQPLFTSYPLELAIQDLRCSIAMKAGLSFAAAKRECEPLMRLTRGMGGAGQR